MSENPFKHIPIHDEPLTQVEGKNLSASAESTVDKGPYTSFTNEELEKRVAEFYVRYQEIDNTLTNPRQESTAEERSKLLKEMREIKDEITHIDTILVSSGAFTEITENTSIHDISDEIAA